jgi:peptide/nickel transport system permease protein
MTTATENDAVKALQFEPHETPSSNRKTEGPYRRLARRFRSNKLAMTALVCLLLIVAAAIFAPLLAPYPPAQISMENRLLPPTSGHLLGTDELGRDTLSRLLYASRTSLLAAVTAVGVAVVIGLPSGLAAGFFGGWPDKVLSRIADAVMCFPYLLLAMAIISALGPGLRNAMTAIGLVYAPRLFRIVRAAVLEVRHSTYIEAARTSGTTSIRSITRHILPNISSPLIVQVTVMLSAALLAEASLSFLGFGVTAPDASWGMMLGRGFGNIRTAPWGTYWPGLAIAVTTLSLNVIGDGLRDSLGRERVRPPRKARKTGGAR